MSGCCCERCMSLKEVMDDLTGKDYGLAPAPGHGHELKAVDPAPSSSMTDLNGAELARLQHMARKRQSSPSLPWEEAA